MEKYTIVCDNTECLKEVVMCKEQMMIWLILTTHETGIDDNIVQINKHFCNIKCVNKYLGDAL